MVLSARAEEKKRREEQTRQDKAKADKRRKDKTKAEKRKAEQLKQSAEITHQQNSRTADGGVRAAAAMPRDTSPAKQSPPRKRRKCKSTVGDKNEHLDAMDSDYLYHLSLSRADAQHFRDIRFVCLGGTNERMKSFAYALADKMGLDQKLVTAVGEHKRYVLYKVGKVLVASHGMGGPSISILLNEVAKLLRYAEADACWIRLGTCGGVGLEAGTVAISQQSLNGALEPFHQTTVLGRPVRREAIFDDELCAELKETAISLGFPVEIGTTMSCDDFYEGQGRLDGCICAYTMEDKMNFLQRAHAAGVRNIEMESLQFGAFTRHVGLRAATICSVLLDRLNGDQVDSSAVQLKEFESRTVLTVLTYVANSLAKEESGDSESKVV